MAHELAYFLCATPRSGTTLLCDLLSATGQAGAPQSYYRRQDIESRAAAWGLRPKDFTDRIAFDEAYLRAVLREGAGETGVFGLRLMWGTLSEMTEIIRSIHPGAAAGALLEKTFGPLVYIHVSRRDKVAQAISLLKAEQSGLWHVSIDGSDRQRTAPSAPVRYDARRVAELLRELEADDASWNDFFLKHRIEPVRIEYESLAASPRLEIQKVLLALSRPLASGLSLPVQTSRMSDSQSAAWADRFRRDQGVAS